MRRRLFLLFALAPLLAAAEAAKQPGDLTLVADGYIMSMAGELPIVLTAPHGGRLKPKEYPDRTSGVTEMDAFTGELAHALEAALFARSGRRTPMVTSLLHRSKLDPNREIKEAAQGDPLAERAWREFHAAIQGALAAAVARHGFAFLIDLHGHAHPIARLELGYALDAKQLNQTDAAFDASGLIALSTLADLQKRRGGSAASFLRGPGSLGDLFESRGLRATPSPKEPQPGNNPFFAGGYIVRQHAGGDTPKVDGLQIECPRPGVRDTAEARARFAQITAEVLAVFLKANHGFDLDAPRPAPR
jgi:N-formylglutamate amidohydrolase